MRALVVFESMYGNTQAIAAAIADGLGTDVPADVVEVSAAPSILPPDVGLLVVGGPTHAFTMSRDSSRQDAARKRPVISRGKGQREWIAGLEAPARPLRVCTFDTRLQRPRWFWGSAARRAAVALRRKGLTVGETRSFFVTWENTLVEGEAARARAWGEGLRGTAVTAREPAAPVPA